MAWFKIDDGFYDNPKVKMIPRSKRMECLGLWVTAGTWSSKHLTDGVIPGYMVEEFGAELSHGDILVQVGLWRQKGTAYQFHDWLEYQPSRASTLAMREKERQRKEEYRAKKAGITGQSPNGTRPDGGGTVPDVSGHPDPTRPDPTRPTKETLSNESVLRKRINEQFETFWQAWPLKKGKEPARKALTKALQAGADFDTIMAGVEAYKRELGPISAGKTFDGRTPKWAQGWLNDQRWTDEPDTPNTSPSAAASIGRPSAADQCLLGVHGKRTATNECVVCGERLETNPF